MSEVEILIYKKIEYYKQKFNEANINGLKTHKAYYHDCHTKLKQMLNILICGDAEGFYCYDKCVANAEEDFDYQKCKNQCNKCKL